MAARPDQTQTAAIVKQATVVRAVVTAILSVIALVAAITGGVAWWSARVVETHELEQWRTKVDQRLNALEGSHQ